MARKMNTNGRVRRPIWTESHDAWPSKHLVNLKHRVNGQIRATAPILLVLSQDTTSSCLNTLPRSPRSKVGGRGKKPTQRTLYGCSPTCSKAKPAMLKRYFDEHGNAIERLANERGSTSTAEEYHVGKAAQAIATFDQAWAQASAPSN